MGKEEMEESETKLQFDCNLDSSIKGYISNGSHRFSIDKQLIEPHVIYREKCSWTTPFVLGDSTTSIDASTSVFDLQVKAGTLPVYTEKDVTLKN